MRAPILFAALALLTTGAAPPAPGTVAIKLVDADDDAAGVDAPFADAVGQALGDQNFTLLSEHSRYIAEVSVGREVRGLATVRAGRLPASVSGGGGGAVLTVPLGSKKTVYRDMVATTLTVRLVNRADHHPIWSGSAMTASVEDAPVAAKLARAAFASYPQTYDRPISVP